MRADCLPQLVGAWASILQLHGNGSNGDGNGGTDGTHTACPRAQSGKAPRRHGPRHGPFGK
jgi:hypothetical protein